MISYVKEFDERLEAWLDTHFILILLGNTMTEMKIARSYFWLHSYRIPFKLCWGRTKLYWGIEPIRSKSAHPCKTQLNYTWMLNYTIYTIINICDDLLIYPWSRFRIKDTSVVNHANKTIAIPVMMKLRSSHQTAIFYPLMREYFVIIVIRKNVHVAYTKWIIITIMVYLDIK